MMAKHECVNREIIDQAREHIKDLPNREARLVRIEECIKSVRGWAIIAAFVGGLLGRAAPDAVNMLTKAAFAQTAGTDTKTVDKVVDIYEDLKSITSASPRG